MQNAIVERHRLSNEYLAAARWCAKQGLVGKPGDPLPELLTGETHQQINANLPRFQMWVSMFLRREHHNAHAC
jgi:hypothetical protein